ncbi:glutamate-5-semialdehyde dehydrogenase [Corynebacterium choanae]|uniref:Gamma-glutamyl phosphate reductase n=1 Tax=Corynebacterium choanae TaxID=1862358 RepID=A0A3G6JBR5_9CORY|nr:Gamma-glutamyl phosphate reductase [Corynebacterium choanae]
MSTDHEQSLARAEAATVAELAAIAQAVAPSMRTLSTAVKNRVLVACADALVAHQDAVLAANEKDCTQAAANGTPASIIDRLRLTGERIAGIAAGLREVAALPDPVGVVDTGRVLPNGLRLSRIRVPLGVMGMVYEARPNVTVDSFGLAFKAGNVALLRGSRSAAHSNAALVDVLRTVLQQQQLDPNIVQLLPCQTHTSVQALITARGLVDVVIPRGGAGLIEAVVTGAQVPTIETGTGNCHTYVHKDADPDMAVAVVLNGKIRRVSVCNATETVLLDRGLDPQVIARILRELETAGVTIHGDVTELVAAGATAPVAATDEDWGCEYLSMDVAVRLVDSIAEAIDHIEQWSSGHTEAIVTSSLAAAQQFIDQVDSAAVSVNASTAFTDGQQYGMGAEIGISTQKLHARGPMGLPELTTTKWVVQGDGHIRPV